MKFAFFTGCLTPAMASQYEASTRKVAEKLGIELVDVKDFACCGFPIKSVNHETALLLAVRNLSVAESQGLDICTICNGCATTLTEANKKLIHNEQLRKDVNEKLEKIGRTYKGNVKVKHFARVLYEDIGPEKIKSQVKKNFKGLKLASHYGCHYLKPSDVYDKFEDPEFPKTLDELNTALGAETVEYEEKMHCCGGVILDVDEKVALAITQKKLAYIKASGADAISLICPLCGVMYDRNQRVVERRFNATYNLPVLYYPQLLGLAIGLDPKSLGLDMNRVNTSNLLSKLNI